MSDDPQRRIISRNWVNKPVAEVIRDIAEECGLSLREVDGELPAFAYFLMNYETASHGLDRAVELAGYEWHVEGDEVVVAPAKQQS